MSPFPVLEILFKPSSAAPEAYRQTLPIMGIKCEQYWLRFIMERVDALTLRFTLKRPISGWLFY